MGVIWGKYVLRPKWAKRVVILPGCGDGVYIIGLGMRIFDWLKVGKPLASVYTLRLSGQSWSYVGAAQRAGEKLQS